MSRNTSAPRAVRGCSEDVFSKKRIINMLYRDMVRVMKTISVTVCLFIGLLVAGAFITIIDNLNYNSPEANETDHSDISKKVYSAHSPVRINSDSDFDTQFPGRIISGYDINGTGSSCCIRIGNCSQPFTVKDCFLHNATGLYFNDSGVFLHNTSKGLITNNNISFNAAAGIYLDFSNENIICNNNLSFNAVGIWLNGLTSNNIISNNTIYSDYYYSGGIRVLHASMNTFSNNTISGHYVGMFFIGSSFNNISNCTVYSNKGAGISLITSDANNVSNNSFFNNSVGINIVESSNNNIISNNTVSSNRYFGVCIDQSNSNVISYNNISYNKQYGITVSGNYNHIHHNNIIGNNGSGSVFNPSHLQAYDDIGKNFWNTSTEGNYWSDWTSPDANHDGIVDNKYNITGVAGADDSFPLVNPVKNLAPAIPEFLPIMNISQIILIAVPAIIIVVLQIMIRKQRNRE
jgi:parallel beta-helix repeat protein